MSGLPTESKTELQKDIEWVKKRIDAEMKEHFNYPGNKLAYYCGVPLTEDNFTFQDMVNILSLEISKRERYG